MREKFPTPRAEDSQCAGGHRGKDDTLYGAICRPKQWPTPRSSERAANATIQHAINRIEKTGYHSNLEEAIALAERERERDFRHRRRETGRAAA